jgi:hypothetical protein
MALLFISVSLTTELTIGLSISSRTVFLAALSDVLRILCRVSSLSPRPIIPLLYSEGVRCFFPNVLTFGFPLPMLSLHGHLRTVPFRTAGTARRICRFRAADNFCPDQTLSWVRFFAHRRRHTTKHRSPYHDPRLSKFISY